MRLGSFSLTTVLLLTLLAGCSGPNEAEVFVSETELRLCPGATAVRAESSPSSVSVDYTYVARIDGISACASLARKSIEKDGYVCIDADGGFDCSRVFDDGSIATLIRRGDRAVFSRLHNR